MKSISGTFFRGFLQMDKPFLIEYADGAIIKPHPSRKECYTCLLDDKEIVLRPLPELYTSLLNHRELGMMRLISTLRDYYGSIFINNTEYRGSIRNFKPQDDKEVIAINEIGLIRRGLFKNGTFDGYIASETPNIGKIENITIEYYDNGKQVPINGHKFTVQAKLGKKNGSIPAIELFEYKTEEFLLDLTSIYEGEYTAYIINNIPHGYYLRIKANGWANFRGKLKGYGKTRWYKIDKGTDGGRITVK